MSSVPYLNLIPTSSVDSLKSRRKEPDPLRRVGFERVGLVSGNPVPTWRNLLQTPPYTTTEPCRSPFSGVEVEFIK